MRRPDRFLHPVSEPEPAPDKRQSPEWVRIAGYVLGTALATALAGAGGMTAAAHRMGIATVADMESMESARVAREQQAAAVDAQNRALDKKASDKRFAEITSQLTSIARNVQALQRKLHTPTSASTP